MAGTESNPYVSRGGLKLAGALEAFALDVSGLVCADLGSNVGGFVDCLLKRGARHVYAVDTGYGTLAWKLRQDERVTVLERSNALHLDPAAVIARGGAGSASAGRGGESGGAGAVDGPARARDGAEGPVREGGGVDLVTIDLAWTAQRHAIPAALRWSPRRIITLIKPHYEASAATREAGGVLADDQAEAILRRTLASMPTLGVEVVDHVRSPIRGGKSKGKAGNAEYVALLTRRG